MRRILGVIQKLLILSSPNLAGSPLFPWLSVSPTNEETTGLWATLLEAAAAKGKPRNFFFVQPVSFSGV
jgi:hypothetical protein